MKLLQKVANIAGRKGLVLQKHAPKILLVTGVTGIVASTIMACRATTKIDAVIEPTKERLDKMARVTQNGEVFSKTYTEKDYKSDKIKVYSEGAVGIVKLYAPAVALGVFSIGCIVGGHTILNKRNIALAAAYKTVSESYAAYRKRVVEELGEDKDRRFKHGTETKVETVVGEDGKKTKKVIDVEDPSKYSEYAKFFDESSIHWEKSPDHNLTFVRCQQNFANDMLRSRGHVFLNEVYDMLDIPRTAAGSVVGWVKDSIDGDGHIDFGLFDGDNMTVRDFVNGYERCILLDFNVDGVIYDLI